MTVQLRTHDSLQIEIKYVAIKCWYCGNCGHHKKDILPPYSSPELHMQMCSSMKKWRCPGECAKVQYNTNNTNWWEQMIHNIYSIYRKESSRSEKYKQISI